MKLAELLEYQTVCHGARRLGQSLGDGYLYLNNPFFQRIRDAALKRHFCFRTDDSGRYFGFPLLGLDIQLDKRTIYYRDNVRPLIELERLRPGYFELRDLTANRPSPNYLLHEAAHAVAFHEAFGRPRNARETMARREHLLKVITGEAFAMTAEYLALCATSGTLHRWFLSVSSYRHRAQAKQTLGQLMLELGQRPVVWALLCAYVLSNYLQESVTKVQLKQLLEKQPSGSERLSEAQVDRLRWGLSQAMRMSQSFRYDTARLFLGKLGYPRQLERVLASDPLQSELADGNYFAMLDRLVQILTPEG
jgi:hypothetical protein